MMTLTPRVQTAVVQATAGSTATSKLPLLVSGNVPVPSLTSPDDVLVRVCAVYVFFEKPFSVLNFNAQDIVIT